VKAVASAALGSTTTFLPTRSPGRSAWLLLTLATLTSTLTGPGQTIGVSVFIDHFVADLGLSRSGVSRAYLIGTLAGAAALPAIGRTIDRLGVRPAQLAIGVLFAAALVNMSLVDGFAWLAVGFVGIRLLGQSALSLVSAVTVAISFERNRGAAIGLFSTISGALMALIPLGLAIIIDRVGWRSAWLVTAVVVGVAVPAIAWFGLRGVGAAAPESSPAGSQGGAGYERAEAVRTAQFWMLVTVSSTAAMLGTALNFHQIDLLGDAGLSSTAAAALFVPQVLGSTVASLGVGFLTDRVGSRYLPAAGAAMLAIAQALAAIAAPGAIVIVYAVTLGAMGGGLRTTTAALLPSWFGTAQLGSIQGALTLFSVGASALGPVVLAEAEHRLGGYSPAVLVLGVLPLAAMVVALVPAANRSPGPRTSNPTAISRR